MFRPSSSEKAVCIRQSGRLRLAVATPQCRFGRLVMPVLAAVMHTAIAPGRSSLLHTCTRFRGAPESSLSSSVYLAVQCQEHFAFVMCSIQNQDKGRPRPAGLPGQHRSMPAVSSARPVRAGSNDHLRYL